MIETRDGMAKRIKADAKRFFQRVRQLADEIDYHVAKGSYSDMFEGPDGPRRLNLEIFQHEEFPFCKAVINGNEIFYLDSAIAATIVKRLAA